MSSQFLNYVELKDWILLKCIIFKCLITIKPFFFLILWLGYIGFLERWIQQSSLSLRANDLSSGLKRRSRSILWKIYCARKILGMLGYLKKLCRDNHTQTSSWRARASSEVNGMKLKFLFCGIWKRRFKYNQKEMLAQTDWLW